VVLVTQDATTDTLQSTIVARAAESPPARSAERLRVADQFATPPDSAQARIAHDLAQALAVGRQSHATPRMWSAAWLTPRPGRVTSAFGTGRQFNGVVKSRHLGIDFAGTRGAPVHATNRGIVALVASFYLAGNVIYIDHGEGIVTGYFHLSAVSVAKGDTVARGQVIGRVGATGRVTGPHLHFAARYGGITIDPRSVLSLEATPQKRRSSSP
jgi:murein DD-endopeptidase MepM/ murein hydrolase activator NlpD